MQRLFVRFAVFLSSLIGPESCLMAQTQDSASKTPPLPPWCLPPNVEADLNFRIRCLNEEIGAHARYREYEEARELQKQAVEITEKLAGPKHFRSIVQRQSLLEFEQLCTLDKTGREEFQKAANWTTDAIKTIHDQDFGDAADRLENADKILARLLRPDSPSIIRCDQFLTLACCFKHDFEKAKLYGTKSLEMIGRIYGEESPDFVNQLGILGGVMEVSNDLDHAEPMLRRAIKDAERLGGRRDVGVAQNLQRLGNVLQKRKQFAEAEAAWREAIALSVNFDMSVERATVFSYRGLSSIYCEQGKYRDAEECIRRALELDERTFGTWHLVVTVDLDRYATLLRTVKRTEEAERMEARAKQIRARIEENKELARKRVLQELLGEKSDF